MGESGGQGERLPTREACSSDCVADAQNWVTEARSRQMASEALMSLPDLGPDAAKRAAATGTDGHGEDPSQSGRSWRAAWRFGADSVGGLTGADGVIGIRSQDAKNAVAAMKYRDNARSDGLNYASAGVAELADATDSKSVAL